MSHYLSEIEQIVRSEVEKQTAELRADLARANDEALQARRMQTENWREHHVQTRIADYRRRWDSAQKKLDDIAKITDYTEWSALDAVERIDAIRRIIEHTP